MKNGGGSFLIPIVVFNILGAMPIVYMELIMGQYSQSGAIPVWNVCPLLKGTGYGTVIITFIFSIYYAVIICWMLLYLVYSFWPTLPWSTCDNDWNIPETCTVTKNAGEQVEEIVSNGTMLTSNQLTTNASLGNDSAVTKMTSSEQFWRYDVLNLSSGLEDLGTIQWPLFGCLALIQVVCFLCIFKGVKFSGKIVYFTVLGPCVLLAVFLVRGAISPGADIGIKYYLTPDINKLADARIWAEACMQVFFSIGPGMGSMVTFGSFNRFSNNCMRDAILVCLLDLTMGLIGGLVVFSIMGHVSYRNAIPIDKFSRSGYGLGFIAYPEAANYLPPSQLWCAMFFFMYVFLGIDSQFPSYEITVTALTDEFPNYLKNKSTLLTLVVIGVSFLLAIPLVTQGGFYLLTLVDWYTATFSLSIISIIEIIIMTYGYGINRVNKNMIEMTGKGVPVYFKICWLFVTPVLLGVTVVFACITYIPPVVDAYTYPTWAIILGWLIAASSLVPIPLYAMYVLYNTPGTLIQRLRINLQPNEKWGPDSPEIDSHTSQLRTRGQHIDVTPTVNNATCDNPAFQTKL